MRPRWGPLAARVTGTVWSWRPISCRGRGGARPVALPARRLTLGPLRRVLLQVGPIRLDCNGIGNPTMGSQPWTVTSCRGANPLGWWVGWLAGA